MTSARPFARLVILVATLAIVGSVGASAATSASTTNPKHFFWAPGQSPQGTVNSVANDIIYHGGNLGDGAIGIEKKPAVYLVYWGPEWANGFTTTGQPTASSTRARRCRTTSTRSSATSAAAHGPACRRSTAATSRGHDELRGRARRGLHHEPEAPAEGRLDRPDAGAGRHRHARPRREPRRRPDRGRRRCARRRTSSTTRTRRTSS